jgi:hypothetical protein
MSNPTNHKLIRIPTALYDRLMKLQEEIDQARDRNGRAYSDIEYAEQGSRGTWIPLHEIITLGLDSWQNHRDRSNRKKRKQGCKHPRKETNQSVQNDTQTTTQSAK